MQQYLKLACASLLALQVTAHADTFFGAGASFPKAAYLAWGKAYEAQSQNKMIYTAVGSGKGLTEIVAARTDFGASDKPFSKTELEQNNLMQFPSLIGGVVPIITVKGIGDDQLQLDGATLAAIFLGKITRWNDAEISKLNPSLSLPSETINVLYRSDKSGQTYNFSNYLSRVSPDWKAIMGEGFTLQWRTGTTADNASALLQKINATPNAIAYVDFTEVGKQKLHAIKLRNLNGNFVAAELSSFTAAASAAKWSAANGFNEILTNQAGEKSWPITTATFIVIERVPKVPENVAATLKFFDWAYRNGDTLAINLGYVPLPDSVADLVRSAWKTDIKNRAGQALF